MAIRRYEKSEANCISVVSALTLVCRRHNRLSEVFDRSKSITCKCRPLLCCLRSKMRCRNASYRIAIAHRTLCACNKTTNAGGNHSDCLCLAILEGLVLVLVLVLELWVLVLDDCGTCYISGKNQQCPLPVSVDFKCFSVTLSCLATSVFVDRDLKTYKKTKK